MSFSPLAACITPSGEKKKTQTKQKPIQIPMKLGGRYVEGNQRTWRGETGNMILLH